MIEANEFEKQNPVFLVSSGRCGSTFVANMLDNHSEVCVVSELFEPTCENPYVNNVEQISGAEFYEILTAQTMIERVKIWRDNPTKEMLYLPSKDEDVSLFLCYTLPHFTNDPESFLQDSVKPVVSGFPLQTPAQHFESLCNWLKSVAGKRFWVERTGASLPHVADFVKVWPHAKYIHVYRDGVETACSMKNHAILNVFAQQYLNMPFDPNFNVPIDVFGSMWNDWIIDAERALDVIPKNQVLRVSFEDIAQDCRAMFTTIHDFVFEGSTPVPQDWLDLVERSLNVPPNKFLQLPDNERELLTKAVAAGTALLKRKVEPIEL